MAKAQDAGSILVAGGFFSGGRQNENGRACVGISASVKSPKVV